MCFLSLEGLDAEALRARFKAMRNHAGIPEGIATTCCLVADEVALNSVVIETTIYFTENPANHPGSWCDTLSIKHQRGLRWARWAWRDCASDIQDF